MEKHLRHLPKTKKGDTCLNCGHKLTEEDNFCPRCSQINDTKRFTFMDWAREILSDFLAYDSRFGNSIKPLITNPGQLSIDYIKGKRASHIHPVRLYLVVSFLFFLLVSLNNFKDKYIVVNEDSKSIITINDTENASIYSILKETEITEPIIDSARQSHIDRFMLFLLDIREEGIQDYDKVIEKYGFENNWLNRTLYKKATEYSTFTMDKFNKMLRKKLPVFAFMFLPIFVIFLNLVYYKKDILYLEHLVFAFHTQSALYILLSVSQIIALIYSPLENIFTEIFLFVVFPIYLYMALKKFYEYPTVFKSILNFIGINIVYFLTSILFFVLAIIVTFFMY